LLVCEQVQKNNHSSLCNNPGVQANTMRQCSIKDSREAAIVKFHQAVICGPVLQ